MGIGLSVAVSAPKETNSLRLEEDVAAVVGGVSGEEQPLKKASSKSRIPIGRKRPARRSLQLEEKETWAAASAAAPPDPALPPHFEMEGFF